MEIFETNTKDKEKFLNDKRLTQAEKAILKSVIQLKEKAFDQIITRLCNLQTQNDLIESQRLFVLAMASNNMGRIKDSANYLEKTINIYAKYGDELAKYEFNAQLFLFFAQLNLKEISQLPSILDRMKELLSNGGEKGKISFARCRFNYYVITNNLTKAKSVLKWLNDHFNEMHPSQQIFHLIDKFIFYLKLDKFNNCENVLNEMKKHRGYSSSLNYQFMRELLLYLTKDKSIYLYEKEFQDAPILLYQMKVLESLESGDKENARLYWKHLHEINQDIYTADMEYKGDKCLFSLCLNKVTTDSHRKFKVNVTAPLLPREKALIDLLTQSEIPVRKEDIMLKLWGEELSSKDDLYKLSMLVSRIKKKIDLDIKTKKGSYSLSVKTKKAS